MEREARDELLRIENQRGPLPARRERGDRVEAQTQEEYDELLAAARVAAEAEALAEGEHRSQSDRLDDSSESPADSLEYHDPVPAPSDDDGDEGDEAADEPGGDEEAVGRQNPDGSVSEPEEEPVAPTA